MKSLPVDDLGLVEIGGVGEMVYRAVRFPAYYVEYDAAENEELITPVLTPVHRPKSGTDHELTGQALLASLCNLYKYVNDPNGTDNVGEVIRVWCSENIHPYDIDSLTASMETTDFFNAAELMYFRREGMFSLKRFLDDLCKLGTTFEYYHALNQAVTRSDVSFCRGLYYEGRICDSLPFLERYRRIVDDAEYLAQLKADMDDRMAIVLEHIPDFRMRLKKDKKKGTIQFGADVQSVFDICWYTFARIIADIAPPVDVDMDCMESTGSILSCLCCGNYFVRRSGRQLYCNDPDCQAERNKRKSRAYYARKTKKQ